MSKGPHTAGFSLYEVLKVSVRRGLWLADLFRPEEFFLMDIGLGTTLEDGCLLASRVIRLDGICFTSGATMPFGPEHKKRSSHFASLAEDKEGAGSWSG